MLDMEQDFKLFNKIFNLKQTKYLEYGRKISQKYTFEDYTSIYDFKHSTKTFNIKHMKYFKYEQKNGEHFSV